MELDRSLCTIYCMETPGQQRHLYSASLSTWACLYLVPLFGFLVYLFFVGLFIQHPSRTWLEGLLNSCFFVSAVLFFLYSLLSLMGEVRVAADSNLVRIFVGIGPFGITRTFKTYEIDHFEADANYRTFLYQSSGILLRGKKSFTFATLLSGTQRDELIARLNLMLKELNNIPIDKLPENLASL